MVYHIFYRREQSKLQEAPARCKSQAHPRHDHYFNPLAAIQRHGAWCYLLASGDTDTHKAPNDRSKICYINIPLLPQDMCAPPATTSCILKDKKMKTHILSYSIIEPIRSTIHKRCKGQETSYLNI